VFFFLQGHSQLRASTEGLRRIRHRLLMHSRKLIHRKGARAALRSKAGLAATDSQVSHPITVSGRAVPRLVERRVMLGPGLRMEALLMQCGPIHRLRGTCPSGWRNIKTCLWVSKSDYFVRSLALTA
jgi:hypothetical protein